MPASKPEKKTGTKKKVLSPIHAAIVKVFPKLEGDPIELQPTFVCANSDHSPRHIAHGATQKKDFAVTFGCKNWKAVK